jgi:hypothetical protein
MTSLSSETLFCHQIAFLSVILTLGEIFTGRRNLTIFVISTLGEIYETH